VGAGLLRRRVFSEDCIAEDVRQPGFHAAVPRGVQVKGARLRVANEDDLQGPLFWALDELSRLVVADVE
jgi:hypothetical protein